LDEARSSIEAAVYRWTSFASCLHTAIVRTTASQVHLHRGGTPELTCLLTPARIRRRGNATYLQRFVTSTRSWPRCGEPKHAIHGGDLKLPRTRPEAARRRLKMMEAAKDHGFKEGSSPLPLSRLISAHPFSPRCFFWEGRAERFKPCSRRIATSDIWT